MKCTECERLILGECGIPPSPDQQAAIASHVAGCATCRQLQDDLAAVLNVWKTETARIEIPNATAAWHQIRPALRQSSLRPRRRLAPLFWISAPLAAAAALAFVIYQPAAPAMSETPGLVRAEFLAAGSATASTMVYVDKESGWLVVWAADASNNGKG